MKRASNSPLPDDTVFYKLFPAREKIGDAVKELDLTCLAVKCSELAKKLAGDHVWHYQSFQLEVCHHVTTGMRRMCLFISPKGLVTLYRWAGVQSWHYSTHECGVLLNQLNKQWMNIDL
jgi:hypothetical protein